MAWVMVGVAAVSLTTGIIDSHKQNKKAKIEAKKAADTEKRKKLFEQGRQPVINKADEIRAMKGEAAAQSKSKVAASIEQQEAANAQAAAKGEAQLQSDKANIEAKAIAEEIGAYGRQETRDIVQLNRMQGQIENAQARESEYEQASSQAISDSLSGTGTALSGVDFTE